MQEQNLHQSSHPTLITLSRALFLLLALFWSVLTTLTLVRSSTGMPPVMVWLLAGLMAGNVLALLLAAWGIGRRGPWFYRLAVALAGANLLLSVTDEFGLLDLVSLLLSGLLLVLLLLAARRR